MQSSQASMNRSPPKRTPIKLGLYSKFKDWKCGKRYKLQKIIGLGSYRSVAAALDVQSGDTVAIKRFENIFRDVIHCKRALTEIFILR